MFALADYASDEDAEEGGSVPKRAQLETSPAPSEDAVKLKQLVGRIEPDPSQSTRDHASVPVPAIPATATDSIPAPSEAISITRATDQSTSENKNRSVRRNLVYLDDLPPAPRGIASEETSQSLQRFMEAQRLHGFSLTEVNIFLTALSQHFVCIYRIRAHSY